MVRNNTSRCSSDAKGDASVIAKALFIMEALLLSVVVILAVTVLAFTSGVVRSTVNNPSVTILVEVEDAKTGASNITLVHLGRDDVRNAFAPSSHPSYFLNSSIFENIEVRINGSIYEGWASLNAREIAKPDFEVGDELELGFCSGWTLSQGDTITVVYVPTGRVLGCWNVK